MFCQDSFELFDKDGTGVIDTEELWVVLRALGSEPKKSEIKALVGEVDKDGAGQIDFDG
jgi:Ca2+-binding EF-hand superfamily protein